MAFSGALTLTDLNDYLGPSQACIKPVQGKDAPDATGTLTEDDPHAASTQIAVESSGVYETAGTIGSGAIDPSSSAGQNKPRARTKLEAAEISLNDCLACSGCVTSAESVLIGMQSLDEIRRVVEENRSLPPDERKILVASISPQTLASLSARYSLLQTYLPSGSNTATPYIPLQLLLSRITHFLKSQLGFDLVFDTTFPRHLALQEHAQEFLQRQQHTRAHPREMAQLPMLASACPGWVCYAEKTHGELLPLVARTKSPQQVAGSLVKKWWDRSLDPTSSAENGVADSRGGVYHVTVMPCYDKKLEASRPDFFDELLGTRDVDCVITTGELDRLMLEEGFDVTQDVSERDESAQGAPPLDPTIPSLLHDLSPGSSSGGYLFSLMQEVWRGYLLGFPSSLSSNTPLQPSVDFKMIRTSDYTEYTLRAPPTSSAERGEILFRGAHCYGFRNLQNLVRKVQRQVGLKSRKSGAAGMLTGTDTADGDGGRTGRGRTGRGRVARGGGLRGRGGVRSGITRKVLDVHPATSSDGTLATMSEQDAAMPDTGSQQPQLTSEEEEQAHGYDYIEVMACPSGCVNGGGQIRPPSSDPDSKAGGTGVSMLTSSGIVESTEAQMDSSKPERNGGTTGSATMESDLEPKLNSLAMDLDPEGYPRSRPLDGPTSSAHSDLVSFSTGGTASASGFSTPLEGSGGAGTGATTPFSTAEDEPRMTSGWQGTTKEWVRRVEEAYWSSSSTSSSTTPPSTSAPNINDDRTSSRAASSRSRTQALLLPSTASSVSPAAASGSTSLDRLTQEILTFLRSQGKGEGGLMRTDYRAVEEEGAVNGLAVQW